MTNFEIIKTTNPKTKPTKEEESSLGFGKRFSDHMFIMDYNEEKGWHNGRVVPYGPLVLDPAAVVFHYGQELFEGLKAYKHENGEVVLFRPIDNIRRMNETCERICIPTIDEEVAMDAIKTIVDVDRDWVPTSFGTSLYVRPFIIGTQPFLGVHPANEYMFVIILAPSGYYYPNGLAPTKIYVEDKYVRAVVGGTGNTKIGANYAISLKAQMDAEEKGYNQVLWLDGIERKYVEEIGTSNAFFVIDGTVITAPLAGTILPGVTRRTVIQVLKDKGIPIEERKLSIDEVITAHKEGKLDEVFASGTAAVISPVGYMEYKGEGYTINNNEIGELSQMLYDAITEIQYGKVEDTHGWIEKVEI